VWKPGPAVVAEPTVDGAALRAKHRARLAADRSPVTILEGGRPRELGQRVCEAVVPKRAADTRVLLKPNLGGFDWFKDPRRNNGDNGVNGQPGANGVAGNGAGNNGTGVLGTKSGQPGSGSGVLSGGASAGGVSAGGDAAGSGLLASTGGNVGMLGGAGLVAVTLGGLAYAMGRRREESTES